MIIQLSRDVIGRSLSVVEKKKRKLFGFKNVISRCTGPVTADYDSVTFMYVGTCDFIGLICHISMKSNLLCRRK